MTEHFPPNIVCETYLDENGNIISEISLAADLPPQTQDLFTRRTTYLQKLDYPPAAEHIRDGRQSLVLTAPLEPHKQSA